MKALALILGLLSSLVAAQACIWDAESSAHEKSRSHDLAATIMGQPEPAEDASKLQARIKDLEASRDETNADWWNNLAGAYLRLNQPEAAVKLLEPVVGKFPDDYGIHANLGTAYHLLGRYADAEKEIARDLEINPEAHFGLERYHLALLQYLMRDAKYQSRHVYVDELTTTFISSEGGRLQNGYDEIFKESARSYSNNVVALESEYESLIKSGGDTYGMTEIIGDLAILDAPPAYRARWNLAKETNLVAGVIYMAQMNPKEPACHTMLGIVAWQQRNYHLAALAFQKAMLAGSPQIPLLKLKIEGLNKYIDNSMKEKATTGGFLVCVVVLIVCIAVLLLILLKRFFGSFVRKR